jgi:uncharacterized protein YgiM (DUF1202 family)
MKLTGFKTLLIVSMLFLCGCGFFRNRKSEEKPPPPVSTAPSEKERPSPPPAPSEDPSMTEVRVIKSGARLRSEPSTRSEIIDVLKPGVILPLLKDLGSWLKVEAPGGGEAYIYWNLVKKIKQGEHDSAVVPLPPVETPKTPFDPIKSYVTVKGANVRPGPGIGYDPPIMSVAKGAVFKADGSTGNWCHGSILNRSGWIYMGLLKPVDDTDPVSDLSREEPASDWDTGKESDWDTGKESDWDTGKESDWDTGKESDTGKEQEPGELDIYEPVSDQEYSESKTDHPEPVDNDSSSTESTESEESTEPVEPTEPEETVPQNFIIAGETAVKVRQDPSPLSRVVGELPPGTAVEVLESGGTWVKIQAGATEGYVLATDLKGV